MSTAILDTVIGRDELLASTNLFDDLVSAGATRVPREAVQGHEDTQCERVYEAEFNVYGGAEGCCEWNSFDDVAAFVREVEASDWWKSYVGEDKPPLNISPVTLSPFCWIMACSEAAPDLWAAQFHPYGWGRATVLHELAHIAVDHQTDGTDVIGHDPEWVGCYLAGLEAFGLAREAEALRDQFRRTGVEWA